MAKEGFDWIWCEHALTVGYRSSLTEIVQIIGRATRDAPGKTSARFTNLIAEPDASEETANEAVNDTLKAIAASLLMEQVLAPRFQFTPKSAAPKEGFDYGEGGLPGGRHQRRVQRSLGAVPHGDRRPRRAEERRGQAHCGGGHSRGAGLLRPGPSERRTRRLRRGDAGGGTDPGAHGPDHRRPLPGPDRRGSRGCSPARRGDDGPSAKGEGRTPPPTSRARSRRGTPPSSTGRGNT